mmetsp:Transcript_104/g.817  ORF Transcript_104/g.817 Transcript_104/m.817 type:complete len:114 (+) Transcript_104:84-425(+)
MAPFVDRKEGEPKRNEQGMDHTWERVWLLCQGCNGRRKKKWEEKERYNHALDPMRACLWTGSRKAISVSANPKHCMEILCYTSAKKKLPSIRPVLCKRQRNPLTRGSAYEMKP